MELHDPFRKGVYLFFEQFGFHVPSNKKYHGSTQYLAARTAGDSMTAIESDATEQLQSFFEELDSLVQSRGARVTYRQVGEDEIVEDSGYGEGEIDLSVESGIEVSPITEFQRGSARPLAAVDCGVARIGETEDGFVMALRATVVKDHNGVSEVSFLRSGAIYLQNRYKAEVLHRIGTQLGKDDFFVELDTSDHDRPRPVSVKSGVADTSYQYGDRLRNWFERLAQRIAVSSIENAIVLFDGALTLSTRDTPATYLRDLARIANSRGNAIIAISKRSQLQVGDRPIRFWLNDVPERPCYRLLTPGMTRERRERVLGNVYAARFSPLGPTFRVDVKPVDGQSDQEALSELYSSTGMRGGYPDILVRAHAHCYFAYPDIAQLQAEAGGRYGLTPVGEVELSGIFAPFGGRFK
jgi:hypothetical protein